MAKNAMNMGAIGSVDCDYVNDAGDELLPCNAVITDLPPREWW